MNSTNVYGYCPICGMPGILRERRLNGNDKCQNGHTYPSKDAVYCKQNIKQQIKYTTRVKRFCNGELGWANWYKTHCDIFWDKGTRQLGVVDTSYIGVTKCQDDGGKINEHN